MAQNQRKAELTAELARIRSRIAQNFGGVRNDLDFSGHAKKTVLKNPFAWVGGATLVGVLLAKLPARRKKVMVTRAGKPSSLASAGQAGLLISTLKIGFDLSRPALTKWASQRVASYLDGTKTNRRFS